MMVVKPTELAPVDKELLVTQQVRGALGIVRTTKAPKPVANSSH